MRLLIFLLLICLFAPKVLAGPVYDNVTVENLTPKGIVTAGTDGLLQTEAVQTGNAGKYLQTDGSNISWQTIVTTDGTVTSVALTLPSIFNVTGSPITVSGTLAATLVDQAANKVFAGPVSGIDAAPTFRLLDSTDIPTLAPSKIVSGTLNAFAGFNATGVLSPINGWSFNPDGSSLTSFSSFDVATNNQYNNMEMALEISDDANVNGNGWSYDYHFDRNNTGKNLDGELEAWQLNARHEGSGHVGNFRAAGIFQNMGANSATADDIEGLAIFQNLDAGNVVQDSRVLYLDLDADTGTIENNASMIAMNSRNPIGNDLNAIGYNNNDTGTVGHDFRFINGGNDGEILHNYASILFSSNGKVHESWSGVGMYINNDIGTATHNNYASGYDLNIQDGHSLKANGNAYNFHNGSDFDSENFRWSAFQADNHGNGGSFDGVDISDTGNMSEEKRGFSYSTEGSARTGTALNLNQTGAYTDDVQAIRVNMDGVTSATNSVTGIKIFMGNASATAGDVHSLSLEGGTTTVNSEKHNLVAGFNIGNYSGITTELPPGTPITGSEFIQQIYQSNLFFHSSMDSFPYGLGVTGMGIVNQVAVDTGVTQPFYRALLFGASNPVGDGTLSEYVAGEGIGLPSFGGSIVVTKKVMMRDGNVLGASFCNGTVDCWIYQAQDINSHNWFVGDLLLGGTATPIANAKLIITDGHTKYKQTTPPTATPDANAGTDATCVVSGTDTVGKIELTTGSAAWASGTQCAVNFNMAYDSAPVCIVTPRNSNAALENLNAFSPDASTTAFTIDFVNADTAPVTYQWSYRCD